MEYADFVLVAVVVALPTTVPVLVILGAGVDASIGFGSLVATIVIFHALFVNPPCDGGAE